MKDVNDIKKDTEEIKNYRATFGHVGFEDSGILIAHISSLITTIESQKEEIEALHDALEMLPTKDIEIHERTGIKINETVSRLLIDAYQKEIESLKAITELAVKGLKDVLYFAPTGTDSFDAANTTLSKIERLQNEQNGQI